MLKIVCKQKVKADKVQEYEELAKLLVTKSREENGNIDYSNNKSINHENVYAFIEVWKDWESVNSHKDSKHFTEIFPKLLPLCESTGEIEIYEPIS